MHICVFPARREEMTIGFGIAGRHLAICLLALWQSLRVGREAGTFSLPLHFFKRRGDCFFGHLWCTFAIVNFILLLLFSSVLWRSTCSEMRHTAMGTEVFPCCKWDFLCCWSPVPCHLETVKWNKTAGAGATVFYLIATIQQIIYGREWWLLNVTKTVQGAN